MDHVFGEEGGMGISFNPVSHRPGHPVIDLDDHTQNNMDQKSTEQENFHDLDQGIGGHEYNGHFVIFSSIAAKQQEVDGQMDYQECYQEKAGESHDHFLGNGRIEQHDISHGRVNFRNVRKNRSVYE